MEKSISVPAPALIRPARLQNAPAKPWRAALQAILNLPGTTGGDVASDLPALQYAWSLQVDAHGRPVDLSLMEVGSGARGAVQLIPLGWLAAQKRQDLPARTEIAQMLVPSEAERKPQEALRRQAREEVAKAAQEKKVHRRVGWPSS
jgi:hypothetical protein